jgi:hypothetical protein
MQTKLNISSSCDPQTHGLIERTHRTIQQILCSLVQQQHHGWLNYLSLAEFAYNDTVHFAIKF